ncbi:glycosyltransferase family 2 protein [Candidatus Dojkabacteria bacterium]|uniref:Glycosyltransferase family 2 protein n=1 Tax=Candidatus Dojkabacteria bacterium TaxID=2099670 RepID=A0A847D240_9BACT|nr:glycosyltransferase family 2 protein [Candidatus Dojkabacteria bacterium]
MVKKWTVIVRTQGKEVDLELKNTLNSLIAQTYENLSVLLTIHSDNEKSIENTIAFLKPYREMLNIKPIVVREKQGNRSYPLNVALENLDCEYISFLDDDDIYYPNMGTTLINAMEEKNKTFAFGRSIDVIERLEKNISGEEYLYKVSKSKRAYQEFSKSLLILENFIPFNTFVVKRSLLEGIQFNEEMDYLEDWHFLKQLMFKKEFSFVQLETLVSEYKRRNDHTDTYNEENYGKWLESREITDDYFKEKEITVKSVDLAPIKSFYEELFENEKKKQLEKITENPGYKIWNRAINNKILKNTVVKFVRKIRELLQK